MSGTSSGAKKRVALMRARGQRMPGRPTADDPDEFWSRVNKNGPRMRHMRTNCHVWAGSTRNGYGRYTVLGKWYSAHVYSFEMKHGPLSPGEKVCHRCDNTACVRQDHLFKGSQRDNVLDAVKKGRHKNPVMHGETNPNAKLTAQQVKQLRVSPPNAAQKKAVAARLGITVHHLNRILTMGRW